MPTDPAAPAAVRVVPVDDALAAAVRALEVAPEQIQYVGDTAFNLDDTRRDPHSEAMAVLAGERVIGFYRLDFRAEAVGGRAFDEPSVGLRAVVIDRREQGRGYGAAAMDACAEDLQRRHPQLRLLALTVNCRNHAAIAAYRRSGFADTGELYLGGQAGPQHLMLRRLQPPSTD
ncbi:GNAT family N-acetyltransferase [Lysobacter silvisoli]|uniref:GNAT family N-acetyltransferase n=1 Tax=Lysobacter silvisoli TaxID=2293254 RepID=A0A371JYQ7_9GAMM|nr:GNAT family N-acetyltransferase [Lysobacter silvisoli]RDZ26806.1 GNAT family N-acetyltransferase [Lysobacter silvisoli]